MRESLRAGAAAGAPSGLPASPAAQTALGAWERLDGLARRWATAPWFTLRLLATTYVFAGLLILLGATVIGEPHQLFRELNPATWYNAALLIAAGVLGILTWRCQRAGAGWRAYDNPWLLTGVALIALAVDDASELHEHVGVAIQALTPIDHPLGIDNPGDALVDLLAITFAGLVVVRRLREYLAVPVVAAQLLVALAFALAMVGIDLFGPSGDWEFVLEECLKLTASAFILGAFAARFRAAA